jgi:predicted metal-dependent enzyme (double-stranded beta helix superfamily)
VKAFDDMDLEIFSQKTKEILQHFAEDKQELRKKILEIPERETLFALCEHYDILDKIVLFISEDDSLRVRLHIFADGYFDRPHNHRWSYSSRILSGGYRHIIYALNENFANPHIQDLMPVIIRQESAGDFYTLHSSQYHSVIAESGTVTLIARGPSDKERFRLFDRTTKESWWQYGASVESAEDRSKKKMTKEQFQIAIEKLEKLGVI